MSDKDPCCQRLVAGGRSPFDVVALGYYDGATSGVAQCRECQRAYEFSLLGWDDERDRRIFGLRGIRADAFESVRRIYAAPVSASDAIDGANAVTLALRDATAAAFDLDLVVAAVDLADDILAARAVRFDDWAAFLQLRS